MIVGTGHAPEHACLYCADLGVLISGDQVLPKITPNISLSASEPDANPLQACIWTPCSDLPACPKIPWFYPPTASHSMACSLRLQQIREHHHERIEALFDACKEPHTAAELMSVMFKRELDEHQIMFAMGESLSHLAYLKHKNRLKCEVDGNGIVRYRQCCKNQSA